MYQNIFYFMRFYAVDNVVLSEIEKLLIIFILINILCY